MSATEPETVVIDTTAEVVEPEPEVVEHDADEDVVEAEIIDVDTTGPTVADELPDEGVEVTSRPIGSGLVPYGAELHGAAEMAATMAVADNVPKALRQKPAAILAVILTGRELGIAPMTALRTLHVIDGQVTLPPKVRLALVRSLKLGKVWPEPGNNEEIATWFAIRFDDPDTTYRSTFTISDASLAKLTLKDNWIHYPARMLSWRALGYLLDDAFTEIGTGLYSPDEMGAVTDVDGHPILDTTGEPLVPGSINQGRQGSGGGGGPRRNENAPAGVAPDHVIAAIRAKIEWLGTRWPEALPSLRQAWNNQQIPALDSLPADRVKTAEALVKNVEQRAGKGEYGDPEPDSPDEAPGAPAGAAQDSGAPDAAGPASSPPAGESGPPAPAALPTSSLPTAQTHVADLAWVATCTDEGLKDEHVEACKVLDDAAVTASLEEAERLPTGRTNADKRRMILVTYWIRDEMERAAAGTTAE